MIVKLKPIISQIQIHFIILYSDGGIVLSMVLLMVVLVVEVVVMAAVVLVMCWRWWFCY